MMTKVKWKDWIWVTLGVLLAVRTGGVVWRLYKAGERVNEAKLELSEASRVNGELKAKLDEVNSPEFVEREAREKLGYGREGEVILLLPEQERESSYAKATEDKPNWRKWWDLYIRI